MRLPRLLFYALFVAIFTLFIFFTRYRIHAGAEAVENWVLSKRPPQCSEDLSWLEKYELGPSIQYASRDIIVNPVTGLDRASITVVNSPLLNDLAIVNFTESKLLNDPHCLPPLTLNVAHGSRPPVDGSNLIFGLQTTIGRLKDTVKHLARWLPHTNARLYAIVIEGNKDGVDIPAKDSDMKALEKEFHDQGMNVTIIHPVRKEDHFEQRYFSLVQVMYKARDANTQWVATIDDDTFFPSLYSLQDLLSGYDPSKLHYIGSLSEDWWAVNNYGLMGFGGASIILSVPMAKIIDEHNDDCKEHPRTTSGDVTIMDCVYRFSSAKLEHVPGLHQVDMHGDLSGFYESGRDMLSLHHWKGSFSDYKLEMEKMHIVADICDDCFLQRWQFDDETVLTNAFTIAQYPEGRISGKWTGVLGTGGRVEKINLERVEETWDGGLNVLHSLAPLRPKVGDEKKSHKLLDSFVVQYDDMPKNKIVRQVYVRKVEGEPSTVLVLNWQEAGNQTTSETGQANEPTGQATSSL
ncbi:glycosyltransferase family 31 protein [Xylogone sp. PMI_703]|nr:glycosyltransferase family 31 protein [Xylogone sp. PMI_703]